MLAKLPCSCPHHSLFALWMLSALTTSDIPSLLLLHHSLSHTSYSACSQMNHYLPDAGLSSTLWVLV